MNVITSQITASISNPCLFAELFVQAQSKENVKAPRHWPMWGEPIGDRWIPLTKGQKRRKNVSIWGRHNSHIINIDCLIHLHNYQNLQLTETNCIIQSRWNFVGEFPELAASRGSLQKISSMKHGFIFSVGIYRSVFEIIITMTSRWAQRRLKSTLSCLFAQPFVQAQIKEIIKAPRHWPMWGEPTGDRWIPLTKGQKRRKCFHLMTSLWCMCITSYQKCTQYYSALFFSPMFFSASMQ